MKLHDDTAALDALLDNPHALAVTVARLLEEINRPTPAEESDWDEANDGDRFE